MKIEVNISEKELQKSGSFEPMEGSFWVNEASSDDLSADSSQVFEAIEAKLPDDGFRIELFQTNGRAFNGSVGTEGSFLATRSNRPAHIIS